MMRRLRTSTMPSVDVERFGAGWLAGRVERDLLHACLGLTQQFLTAPLERLAALVDRNRLLERDLAFLEPLDDRLQFLDRPLEGQFLDVGVVVFGHRRSRHLPSFSYVTTNIVTIGGRDDPSCLPARRSSPAQSTAAAAAATASPPCLASPEPPRASLA